MNDRVLSNRWAVSGVTAGFILVGFLDYITGAEIRATPLYFLPLSLAAWRLGPVGAVLAVMVAVVIWVLSNSAAGLRYTADFVWVLNALSQTLAFGTVAGLLVWARRLLDREKQLARTDSLTRLSNVRAFRDDIEAAAAASRRSGRPLTLAYIDLDNFKCVNDRHGHSRGDRLLTDVAAVIRASVRVTDSAARMGGDEFALCLPDTDHRQAAVLFERLRAALVPVFDVGECQVSASIGAFCWARPPEMIDAMIAAADQKMYEVKKGGKNSVEIVYMPATG